MASNRASMAPDQFHEFTRLVDELRRVVGKGYIDAPSGRPAEAESIVKDFLSER